MNQHTLHLSRADFDGAIFDLDGTIMDSMFIWDTIGSRFLKENGITPPADFDRQFKTMSLQQAAEYYQRVFDSTMTIEGIMEAVNRCVEHLYFDEVLPKANIKHFLAACKKAGVKMCVATATDRYLVEAALRRVGLLRYFSDIFTCTSVGAGKDEPVIYREALRHLGTEKQKTIVFEDAYFAAATAKRDGFRVYGIFDKCEEKSPKGMQELCDAFFYDYDDLSIDENADIAVKA